MLRAVHAEVVVDIDRSPEDVYAYLTDVTNLPNWQSGVHSARREGSQIHESRHMLGRELSTTLEIEESERPRLFTIRAVDTVGRVGRRGIPIARPSRTLGARREHSVPIDQSEATVRGTVVGRRKARPVFHTNHASLG